MPEGASGKPIKRGAWMTFCDSSAALFAAKGNGTREFYRSLPTEDRWDSLAPLPLGGGSRSKTPGKGSRGAAGGGAVYFVPGNNTYSFWRYDIARDTWLGLPDVPAGRSGKPVRSGSDMVWVEFADTGWVYLLKGDRCDFCRYNTVSGRWQELPDAPDGLKDRWKDGSWLAHDGKGTLYAHKARYYDPLELRHRMWKFDVRGDTWHSRHSPGMPLYGLYSGEARKKKSGRGGSGAYERAHGRIYALKGANSQQFWRFEPERDSWFESDTIPRFEWPGKGKRVGHGGDIVDYGMGALFALKGNKTLGLWCYILRFGRAGQPPVPGVLGSGLETSPAPDVVLSPSPARGFARLVPRRVTVGDWTLVDAAGREVLAGSGSSRLDLRGVPPGVYVVRADTPAGEVARKLVVLP